MLPARKPALKITSQAGLQRTISQGYRFRSGVRSLLDSKPIDGVMRRAALPDEVRCARKFNSNGEMILYDDTYYQTSVEIFPRISIPSYDFC